MTCRVRLVEASREHDGVLGMAISPRTAASPTAWLRAPSSAARPANAAFRASILAKEHRDRIMREYHMTTRNMMVHQRWLRHAGAPHARAHWTNPLHRRSLPRRAARIDLGPM